MKCLVAQNKICLVGLTLEMNIPVNHFFQMILRVKDGSQYFLFSAIYGRQLQWFWVYNA